MTAGFDPADVAELGGALNRVLREAVTDELDHADAARLELIGRADGQDPVVAAMMHAIAAVMGVTTAWGRRLMADPGAVIPLIEAIRDVEQALGDGIREGGGGS